jgi:dolichol kinase
MNPRKRELWRKVAHICVGTTALFGAYCVGEQWGGDILDTTLGVLIAALILADVLIADYGWKLPLYHNLQRTHEERGLHSATLAVLGSVVAYKLFALPIAIAAIGMLIYGDAAAAIAGVLAGTGRKKSAAARIIALLAVNLAIGFFVFSWIGVVMAVVATLAECCVKQVDDALTIPLFAGAVGQLLALYFW